MQEESKIELEDGLTNVRFERLGNKNYMIQNNQF